MIRDRGAQTVAVWVFGTICEADLPATQCGYQHQRSACKAVRQVHCLLNTSHRKGVDADLTVYYESIPHRELRKSAVRRVCDQQVLHLIEMWITVPVDEEDEQGGKRRRTHKGNANRGVPQGFPLSPLLSNRYMRRFLLAWKAMGYEREFGGCIVTYSDDLVICCTRQPDLPLLKECDRSCSGRGWLTRRKLTCSAWGLNTWTFWAVLLGATTRTARAGPFLVGVSQRRVATA